MSKIQQNLSRIWQKQTRYSTKPYQVTYPAKICQMVHLKFSKFTKKKHFRKDYENSKNAIFLKMHAPFVMIRVDLIMFNRGHAECITSLLGCLLKYSHQTHLALEDLTFHLSLLRLNFRKMSYQIQYN